jgi:hypothetical protein
LAHQLGINLSPPLGTQTPRITRLLDKQGNEWEVGIGTYTASGTTLARTTVLSNSSATQPSALSFSAGTKDVFVSYPAEYSVTNDPPTQNILDQAYFLSFMMG